MKQSSLYFFFSPSKESKKATPLEIPKIQNQEIENENKKSISDDSLIADLLSRGSSPLPASSLESFEFNICKNESSANEIQQEKNQLQVSIKVLNQDKILTPDWKITSSNSKSEGDSLSNNIPDDKISMSNEGEKNLHWELEIIEHRIQFGKDLDHPHPAMAPDVLKNEGLHDIRLREKSRLKHYEQVNCIEYIPDFWQPRIWDDNYPKLEHAQSEFLLQEMIEAPFKEKSDNDNEYESPESYSSSSSSPLASASNSSSDDDDDERCETKSGRKPRIRFGFRNKIEKRVIHKPVPLRLTSLLFDTDNEFDTDLENF